jgi:hypothetical protein
LMQQFETGIRVSRLAPPLAGSVRPRAIRRPQKVGRVLHHFRRARGPLDQGPEGPRSAVLPGSGTGMGKARSKTGSKVGKSTTEDRGTESVPMRDQMSTLDPRKALTCQMPSRPFNRTDLPTSMPSLSRSLPARLCPSRSGPRCGSTTKVPARAGPSGLPSSMAGVAPGRSADKDGMTQPFPGEWTPVHTRRNQEIGDPKSHARTTSAVPG